MFIIYFLDRECVPKGDASAAAVIERCFVGLAAAKAPVSSRGLRFKLRLFSRNEDGTLASGHGQTLVPDDSFFRAWSAKDFSAISDALLQGVAGAEERTGSALSVGEWVQKQVHEALTDEGSAQVSNDGALVVVATNAFPDEKLNTVFAKDLSAIPQAFPFRVDSAWIETSALSNVATGKVRIDPIVFHHACYVEPTATALSNNEEPIAQFSGSRKSGGKQGGTNSRLKSENAGNEAKSAPANGGGTIVRKDQGYACLLSLEQILFGARASVPIEVFMKAGQILLSKPPVIPEIVLSDVDLEGGSINAIQDILGAVQSHEFHCIFIARSESSHKILQSCWLNREAITITGINHNTVVLAVSYGFAVVFKITKPASMNTVTPCIEGSSEAQTIIPLECGIELLLTAATAATMEANSNCLPEGEEPKCEADMEDENEHNGSREPITIESQHWMRPCSTAITFTPLSALSPHQYKCSDRLARRAASINRCALILEQVASAQKSAVQQVVDPAAVRPDLCEAEETELVTLCADVSDDALVEIAKQDFRLRTECSEIENQNLLSAGLRLRTIVGFVRDSATRSRILSELCDELDGEVHMVVRGVVAVVALGEQVTGKEEAGLKKRLRHALSLISISWRDPQRFASFLKSVLEPLAPINLWNWLRHRFLEEDDQKPEESPGGQFLLVRSRRRLLPLPPVPSFHLDSPDGAKHGVRPSRHFTNSGAIDSTPRTQLVQPVDPAPSASSTAEAIPNVPLVSASWQGQRRKRTALNHFTESLSDPQQLKRIIVVGNSGAKQDGAVRHRLTKPVVISESPRGSVGPTPVTVERQMPRFNSNSNAPIASKQLFLTPLAKSACVTPLMAVKSHNALASSVPSSAQSVQSRPGVPAFTSRRRLVEPEHDSMEADIGFFAIRRSDPSSVQQKRARHLPPVFASKPGASGLEDEYENGVISETSRTSDNA